MSRPVDLTPDVGRVGLEMKLFTLPRFEPLPVESSPGSKVNAKDVWAILLQCNLTGKAQEACSSLSVEDGLSYDKLKSAILRV